MRELGAMPRMKVFLITFLSLCVCLRYYAPAVVFLCLPALLAQPLRGAAVFCWQDVLQGVWYGSFCVASLLLRTRYIQIRLLFQTGKRLINDKRNYSWVARCSQNSLTFPSIMLCWFSLLLNKRQNPDLGCRPLPLTFRVHVTRCFDLCSCKSCKVWLNSNWQTDLGLKITWRRANSILVLHLNAHNATHIDQLHCICSSVCNVDIKIIMKFAGEGFLCSLFFWTKILKC